MGSCHADDQRGQGSDNAEHDSPGCRALLPGCGVRKDAPPWARRAELGIEQLSELFSHLPDQAKDCAGEKDKGQRVAWNGSDEHPLIRSHPGSCRGGPTHEVAVAPLALREEEGSSVHPRFSMNSIDGGAGVPLRIERLVPLCAKHPRQGRHAAAEETPLEIVPA